MENSEKTNIEIMLTDREIVLNFLSDLRVNKDRTLAQILGEIIDDILSLSPREYELVDFFPSDEFLADDGMGSVIRVLKIIISVPTNSLHLHRENLPDDNRIFDPYSPYSWINLEPR